MNKKKKSKKRIGKINPIFYHLAYPIVNMLFTKKYNITYDKDVVKDIKGPAIIVATHTSDMDHILSALTFYPVRPTYIASAHHMYNPSTAKIIKLMHVIPKKMFTPDVSTVINIMHAKKENAVLVLFVEGRLSCYGHTLPIAEGTAELVKKLGVPLYSWKAEGAYLTFPKWRDKGDSRIGKIKASVKSLLTAEEISKSDVSEIKKIIEAAIVNDDELAMQGVEYKSEDMTRGVDRILFKCPSCLKESGITAGGNHIRCKCGLDVTLDSCYRLHGAPFSRINEWFDWQQASIDTENEVLKSKARLGYCGKDDFMDHNAGEGEIYLDKDVFKLSGIVHGEKIEFSVSSDKIGAFPISPGEHFDIYHNGKLIYIYPQPDARMAVKWVCFIDNLNAKKKVTN